MKDFQGKKSMDFIRLFEPITINTVKVNNRIVMPAMGLFYTDNYSLNDRYKAFYRERARGGVGLMLIGPIAIDRVGSAPFMPGIFDDRHIPPFRDFLDELHRDTEAKLGTQLFQMGRNASSLFSGLQPIAPSPIPGSFSREIPREMTKDDIEEVKKAFADGARRAKEAGFDYIEIVGCTGYLISQFLSPVTNHRNDEYGGPIENRMRFGLEVIGAVRASVGDDIAVGIRVAGNDFMDGGNTNRESVLFCIAAEEAGVDAINVTGGWHETNVPQLPTLVPPGAFIYLARGIKEKVNVPVFASNRLGDPFIAERALRSGSCDMICWGRPLIADPNLPIKAKEGRLNEIVPCISCNQGCFDSIFSGVPVHCVLNPRASRENELRVEKAQHKKRISVAGGGPGGMEFALTAAERGHDVTLYERGDDLGGQINLAKVPPGKKELQRIIDSMENRMINAGVTIKLKTTLTPEMIQKDRPDVLVIASGAKPLEIDVPGMEKPHVVSAWDVLKEKVYNIGKNVVIIGGSATGCETAHYIASLDALDSETFAFLMYHNAEDPAFAMKLLHQSNRNITVVDIVERFADNVGRTNRWPLLKSLRLIGVSLRPETRLIEITDDAVIVETKRGKESIPADTVIMAVGAQPVDDLTGGITADGLEIIKIGDAREPRRITEAIREGFEEALKV
jgi:2,4-dienoyl-CoA reductase (NADPH2)